MQTAEFLIAPAWYLVGPGRAEQRPAASTCALKAPGAPHGAAHLPWQPALLTYRLKWAPWRLGEPALLLRAESEAAHERRVKEAVSIPVGLG